MDSTVFDYRTPGAFTAIRPDQAPLAAGLPDDPVGICAAVAGLVVSPEDATAAGVPGHRHAEREIRPVAGILDVLAALDPAPLDRAREPARRVVGTCRHLATLATALLRHRGFAARARCGFATYFLPGRSVDHWITECRHTETGRWHRIDSELLGTSVVDSPADLAPGEFLTGGEAWTAFRAGGVDPDLFGVAGTDHAWGVGEIRGNAIRDLAALAKLETLPWDEWGRMTASYRGTTGPEYDALLDAVAAACAGGDPAGVARCYATEDLAVPADLVR